MSLDRVKTISDIVAAWFGLLAITAGGIFAVVQYLEKERGDRVKFSLELLTRANDAHVVTAKARLTGVWQQKLSDLYNAIEKNKATPGVYEKFILQTTADEALLPQFATMLDFYETVQICVEKNVCDAPVACALFWQDAARLYSLHYPVIRSQRKDRSDEGYASRLQAFANMELCR